MSENKAALNPDALTKIQQQLKTVEENPPQPSPVIEAADKLSKNLLVDQATGVYNRNYWDNFVENRFDPSHNPDLTLIVCDLNGLKQINDQEGHQAGDQYLKDTAKFLKESFRESDQVVRYGGDEFLVICHRVDKQTAFEDKVNQQFSQYKLKEKNLSFAYGIAHFDKNQDQSNIKNTFDRADQLMYAKKAEQKESK